MVSLESKKRLTKCIFAVWSVLLCVAAAVIAYALSPLHLQNISDKTIVEKGAEYTFKLTGVSKYDENGFYVSSNDFGFSDGKVYIVSIENGFSRVTRDGDSGDYLFSKYNSLYVPYEKYDFSSQRFKSVAELESFFEEPEPIYDFDLDKLSYYISDIISYKRKFSGKATARVYRGRYVFTEIYIGDEKVLELKK